ncbi:MAG: Dabb family protein [Opitutaceae bacterium]
MKKIFLSAVILFSLPLAIVRAQSPAQTTPKSVIHVVTVSWKAGATPAQIQAAMDGVKALPGSFKGIVRVWTKPIKVQGDRAFAFVMEFADEAALAAYTDSPAQKKWYEVYVPIREASTTFDITN